jgi:hypothetical protein
MKKFLMVLGAVFLVLIVLVGGLVGYAIFTGTQLDASSKAYVDESVPAIATDWSKDELVKRASPQLREQASDVQIEQLFGTLANKLGAFKSYDGAKGDSNINFTTTAGKIITASYIAKATYQYGKAEIQIKLIQHAGAWQILGFHVDLSPL